MVNARLSFGVREMPPTPSFCLRPHSKKWLTKMKRKRPARLQLADRVALIPGMTARELAVAALGAVCAIEGGKEAADQIGQVRQCASMLAVIRQLEMDGAYLHLYAHACLCGEPCDLYDRRRARSRLAALRPGRVSGLRIGRAPVLVWSRSNSETHLRTATGDMNSSLIPRKVRTSLV